MVNLNIRLFSVMLYKYIHVYIDIDIYYIYYFEIETQFFAQKKNNLFQFVYTIDKIIYN